MIDMSYYTESKPLTMDEVGEYLYHHGIKGQHWGVRRYQNPDGTLTPEGKQRYRSDLADNIMTYAKKGASIGTKIGAVAGAGLGVGVGTMLAAGGLPVAAVVGMGAMYGTAITFASRFDGYKFGAIYGAVKTGTGKKWAKKNLGVE